MAILTKYILMYRLNENETLVINSLNSALDVIDDKTKDKIENMQNGIKDINLEEDAELYNQLKNRGYLFENKQLEETTINKYRLIHEELIKRRLRNNFTICPTMGCNLRCIYCFETNDNHVNFDVMTDSQLDGIFKCILQTLETNKEKYEKIKNDNPPTISIFGGEPLLNQNYDIINRILEFADANKMYVNIITNGTNIIGYKELFEKHSKILHFQITIDGEKEIHDTRRIRADGKGTFDTICETIDVLLSLGIKVGIRINVDKANIKALRGLESVIKTYEWDKNPLLRVFAAPVLDFCGKGQNIMTSSEFLDTLIKERLYGCDEGFINGLVSATIGYLDVFFNTRDGIKPWKMDYCDATSGANLVFSPDGMITTCLSFAGKGKHLIGTFDENGINLDSEAVKMWNERSVFRIEKCRNCKYAFLCGGGCPVAAVETNNNIDDVVCSDIENTLERYVFYNKDKLLNR